MKTSHQREEAKPIVIHQDCVGAEAPGAVGRRQLQHQFTDTKRENPSGGWISLPR